MRLPILIALALISPGCDQLVSSDGQEGRLRYSLATDNEVPERDLTEALIVAGHQQRLDISLTADGYEQIATPELIQHTVLPREGITVLQEPPVGSEPPDLLILAAQPGLYTLESHVGDELIDRINLTFASPASFELATFVRAPWTADFAPMSGNVVPVSEGAQVTLQAAPVDAQGRRLAGDLQTELAIDPQWAAVPGVGVIDTDDSGVWKIHGDINFYLIEPELVSFTVKDPVSGALRTQSFQVTAADRPTTNAQ